MSKRSKKRLSICLLALAFIGLGGYGTYSYNQYQANKQEYKMLSAKANNLQNQDKSLVKSVNMPKYVVNAKGHMDYTSQKTIQQIKYLFSNIDTWKNQSQYFNKRREARQFVKDPNFFKTYMKSFTDENGGNELDNMNIKSRSAGTKVYEIRPGQYLVIASMYFYHNPQDFTQKAAMSTTKKIFIFDGDSYRISKAQELKNLEQNQ